MALENLCHTWHIYSAKAASDSRGSERERGSWWLVAVDGWAGADAVQIIGWSDVCPGLRRAWWFSKKGKTVLLNLWFTSRWSQIPLFWETASFQPAITASLLLYVRIHLCECCELLLFCFLFFDHLQAEFFVTPDPEMFTVTSLLSPMLSFISRVVAHPGEYSPRRMRWFSKLSHSSKLALCVSCVNTFLRKFLRTNAI